MKRNTCFNLLYISVIILVAACVPLPPTVDANATATQDSLNNAATQTAAAFVTTTPFVPVTDTPSPEPVPTEISPTPTQQTSYTQQFLAYVNNGQLLVTDVTNNVQGGTTQYTVAGESDQVSDLAWSPSGEFVAFVSSATGAPHVFYTYALGQSSPTDLGPGSAPAWSPDSKSVAYVGGAYPDENIWISTIDHPAPRQLTFQTNYAWGRPVFTPDEQSLVVEGADRNNMGASGNTTFTLEYLELDGSGTRTPLPGESTIDGARLPNDAHFSPDGKWLAFSTSFHLSACASPGAYYVNSSDGGNRQELISPSLKPAIDFKSERYYVGLSYAWTQTSDGLVALGNVVDCGMNSPTSGQIIAGPQMSILGLDGSERSIIPGFFYGISTDRTGTLIAAAHYKDGFQDQNPLIEIYSVQTGQPVLSLGPGSNPQFQP
jgi:WD40 repeat protein